MAIPAGIAAVCDLLKDAPRPRPLLSACLCGSCVTNGPWPSPGIILQMDRAGDGKGSAQGRVEKLVLICFGPLGQNKTSVSPALLSPLSDTKCKFWRPLFVLALTWVISELVFVSRAHFGALSGEPGPYSRGKVCHPVCSCSRAVLIHCLFCPVQNLMSSHPSSCAVPHEEFRPGNITFFFAMSIFLRNFLDFFYSCTCLHSSSLWQTSCVGGDLCS